MALIQSACGAAPAEQRGMAVRNFIKVLDENAVTLIVPAIFTSQNGPVTDRVVFVINAEKADHGAEHHCARPVRMARSMAEAQHGKIPDGMRFLVMEIHCADMMIGDPDSWIAEYMMDVIDENDKDGMDIMGDVTTAKSAEDAVRALDLEGEDGDGEAEGPASHLDVDAVVSSDGVRHFVSRMGAYYAMRRLVVAGC